MSQFDYNSGFQCQLLYIYIGLIFSCCLNVYFFIMSFSFRSSHKPHFYATYSCFMFFSDRLHNSLLFMIFGLTTFLITFLFIFSDSYLFFYGRMFHCTCFRLFAIKERTDKKQVTITSMCFFINLIIVLNYIS